MVIYLDSAELDEIRYATVRGIRGVTSNPSILAKSGNWQTRLHQIARGFDLEHLSIELTTADPLLMLSNADEIIREFGAIPGIAIKVPIGWQELSVIHNLVDRGISVNVTACMSLNQCIIAANAGASYVSIFWGRIRDIGGDAAAVVHQTKTLFLANNIKTKIIVGSIRQMMDINEAFLADADIVTTPYKFLAQMTQHPKTDEVVAQFMRDVQVVQHV